MTTGNSRTVRFAHTPLGLLTLFLLLYPLSAYSAPRNIVVILTDDQGYGDVSYSGLAPDIQTPGIDALAEDGMRFENFYANSGVCSPSRAALMTGRYPGMVGVPGLVRRSADVNLGFFNPNGPTLPEMLKGAGYTTALVGKWHLGDRLGAETPNLPTRRGFDLFRGWLGSAMDYFTHESKARDDWPGDDLMMHNETVIPPTAYTGIHATTLFTNWAIEFVREQAGAARPFFLYLAYTAPHTPLQPPQSWLERVMKREPGIDVIRAKYVAQVEHLDSEIGRFVQTLKTSGVYDDTLLIYLSDNGGDRGLMSNNGPYRDGKLSLYEGGLRVPMFAVWPQQIPRGSAATAEAMTMDIYPTIAEAAGIPVEHEIDGRSFLPVLQGQGPSTTPRHLIFERMAFEQNYRYRTIYGARQQNWKLVQQTPITPYELYDLSVDPSEQENLAASNPVKVAELRRILDAYVADEAEVPFQPPLAMEHGIVSNLDGNWRRIALRRRFRSPVVVASPQTGPGAPPVTVQVRGIADRSVDHDSFEIRLARADGSAANTAPANVRFAVFEEGVYRQAHHGVTLEAFKFDTSVIDGAHSWLGTPRRYANDYSTPVVLGQVMADNDARFTAFWSRGKTPDLPPDGDTLKVGRHTGEDPRPARNPQSIGYVVTEGGVHRIQDQSVLAGIGAASVGSVANTPPYTYPLQGLAQASNAVLSQAGMKGIDGSWATFYGPSPVTATTLNVAVDEDQLADAERWHTAEQLSYLVFGSGPEPGTTAPPSINPGGGIYDGPVQVSLTTATAPAPSTDAPSGVTIYYTLDGTAPSSASTPYTGPITLESSATVKAVSIVDGHGASPVANAAFSVNSGDRGVLEATLNASPATVNLTAEGTLDWVHWGLSDRGSVNRKLGVAPQISDFTNFYSAPRAGSVSRPRLVWSDGTPSRVATTGNAVRMNRPSNGFLLRAPADDVEKTLRIYFQVESARVRVEAELSDGTIPAFTRVLNQRSGLTQKVLEVTYSSRGSGVELVVIAKTQDTYGPKGGNVTLAAATLQAAPQTSLASTQ